MLPVCATSFFPWLCSSHGFCKHSREQYEKLAMMHKNMQKLYEGLGNFFAFDPHSVSMEDFFGDLANFRVLFLVSTWWLHTETPLFFSRLHEQQPPPTHTYIILRVHLCANTHLVSLSSRCVLASEAEGPGWGWKHAWELQCYNHSRYLRQLPSHAEIFWLCLLIFAYFSGANTANQLAADRKFFSLLEFTASPHQFGQRWHARTAICFVNSSICQLFILKKYQNKKKDFEFRKLFGSNYLKKKKATCSYYQLFNGWSFRDITSISSMLADDLDNILLAIISQVIFS